MRHKTFNSVLALVAVVSFVVPAFAQRGRRPAIFAVLDAGKTIEPIAIVEKGKLEAPTGGDAGKAVIEKFNASYYAAKTKYRLIFGAANAGVVSVLKSDASSECAANLGTVSVATTKTKLGGFVMGLATDVKTTKPASGLRRKPTADEKTMIEKLVRAEFATQKVKAPATLRYQNLTALDLDNDKSPEFVGSYWVVTGKTSRALLFFIAEKNASGVYQIGYGEFNTVEQDKVMSGEISTVDAGVYHELLLDAFDYDDDGAAEVFTYVQGFEGSSFNVYKKSEGKWTKAFEGSNYHCGY